MSDRLFSVRWDVDHHVCITDGIPRILEVCREFGVRNTFFVNMGRSTSLREWLGKGFARSKAKFKDPESVSLIEKAGWPRFILEACLGRPVGLSFIEELQAVQTDGHELGLHGGMDHVVWSRRFSELSKEALEADVNDSYQYFTHYFGRPAGFASPGFRSDEGVLTIVDRLGFDYNGDQIGGAPSHAMAFGRVLQHWTIPVTLAGPRTIPFLEWHGARRTPEDQVLAELDEHMASNTLVVLYGHPCYEGVRSDVLRKVLRRALDAGFCFVTHREIAARLEDGLTLP